MDLHRLAAALFLESSKQTGDESRARLQGVPGRSSLISFFFTFQSNFVCRGETYNKIGLELKVNVT